MWTLALAMAWAGPFDGRWIVESQRGSNDACQIAIDGAISIEGADLRVGGVDLGGSIDGDALFAMGGLALVDRGASSTASSDVGLTVRRSASTTWSLHRDGSRLVGAVHVDGACTTDLALVLARAAEPALAPALAPEPAPAPAPQPAPAPITSTLWWTVEPAITFKSGTAEVLPESEPALAAIADKIRAKPDAIVEIAVHTDAMGADSFNLAMSQKRADAIAAWLVANGIPKDRIVAHGYGEGYPIDANATVEGRAKNRRVELRIVGPAP